jgi:hypothetical protein
MLLDRIEGRLESPFEVKTLECRLVVRKSTGRRAG